MGRRISNRTNSGIDMNSAKTQPRIGILTISDRASQGVYCKRAVYLSPFSARFVTAENGDLGVILALPRYSKLRIKSSLAAALLLAAPPTV